MEINICRCGHRIVEFKSRNYHLSSYSADFEQLNRNCTKEDCSCRAPEPLTVSIVKEKE